MVSSDDIGCFAQSHKEVSGGDQGDELVFPIQSTVDNPPEDEEEDRTIKRLIIIHRNLGHPSNKLLQQILRDAQAPAAVIAAAGELHCPLCSRFAQTEPARPASVSHARKFNETLCIDMAYHDLGEGRQALVIHFVDEASRSHIADLVREGTFRNSDKDKQSVLGM